VASSAAGSRADTPSDPSAWNFPAGEEPSYSENEHDFCGEAEQLCEYFPSSGNGQVNVEFHLDG
jgi:hypothetical protein